MKRPIAAILFCTLIACAPQACTPLVPNLNFNIPVPPLPAVLVDLEGQWTITGADSKRSCLVIQESRVSILDITCSSDGRGAAARIVSGPVISRAGNTITLSVTYNSNALDPSESRLTFIGNAQIDSSFIGTRTDEQMGGKNGTTVTDAVMSHQ